MKKLILFVTVIINCQISIANEIIERMDACEAKVRSAMLTAATALDMGKDLYIPLAGIQWYEGLPTPGSLATIKARVFATKSGFRVFIYNSGAIATVRMTDSTCDIINLLVVTGKSLAE
jgi:hypothetical protein